MQSLILRSRNQLAWGGAALVLIAAAGLLVFGRPFDWNRLGSGNVTESSLQGHADAHAAQAVTVYQGPLEVFYDLPPIVAGDSVNLALHLSDVDAGEPVTGAKVALGLEHPGAPSRTPTRPRADGIYVVRKAFPTAGIYEARLEVERNDGAVTIPLPAIQVYATSEEAHAAHSIDQKSAPQSPISFSKEQQWRLRTLSEPAVTRELVERLIVPGKVIAAPGAAAVVTPPAPGTLLAAAEHPFPRVGDEVAQGQVMALLEPSSVGGSAIQLMANRAQLETLDAELSVKQTQVETLIRATEEELAFAEKALERMKTLAATGTSATKALYEAQLAVDLATVRQKGAQEQLKPYADARNRLSSLLTPPPADSTGVERTNLRVPLVSPVHGTLVESHATAGQFLNQGDQVFQIIDMRTVWIEARVSEYDLAKVEQAPGASYRLSAYPDDLRPILGAGGGRLVDVGVVVDPANRTLPVRYEIPNRDQHLRIGMFAEVLVETQRREQALAVPAEALVDDSGEITVYVQRSGESFEKRPVRTGVRDGDWVEIVEGLSPGERVVSQGAFALRLAGMSTALPPHGHDH